MGGLPVLRRGAHGDAVRTLQRVLTDSGFPTAVDGDFGSATDRVVRGFQRAHDLEVDGVVGQVTWAALGQQPTPDPPSRRLSQAGAVFIGRFEGFRPSLYNDPVGHCTIGFGHLVHRGHCNGSEPAELRAGISHDRALELLAEDAAVAAATIAECVAVPLEQHEFDALVSFAFNVGTGAFRDSTLLRELNAGRRDDVPAQLARWTKAGGRTLSGLVTRRQAEGRLFRDGNYA